MQKKLRGFATMDPARLKEVSSKGGKSIPAHKRSFSVDRKLAAMAGHNGGTKTQVQNAAKKKGEA